MDDAQVKHVLEAALLAAQRPLPVDTLLELFKKKGPEVDRALIRSGLSELAADYEGRGIELVEVASGFRIQVRSSMSDWLQPLWEERAPRYTRALLETLALIAYRQPVTRGDIEEVRGVAVSPNIVRTLLERGWVRIVGHKDVPGKPEMLGTTREFLDYFGLKSLQDLPALSDLSDGLPELSPQHDLVDEIEGTSGVAIVEPNEHGSDPENSPENGPENDAENHHVVTGASDADVGETEEQQAKLRDLAVLGATVASADGTLLAAGAAVATASESEVAEANESDSESGRVGTSTSESP